MRCGLSFLYLRVRSWGGRVDHDDVLTLAHLSEIQPVATKQATKMTSTEKSKQKSACTAVPVRKGSGTITTCNTRSRITCYEITPGT